jgi:hypothetical protein
VINGCYLKVGGVLRVIDTARGQKCLTSLEVPISWSQQGPRGDPGPAGPPGANGSNGADGVSPTVAQLAAGDANCPAGGAAIADAAGTTAYVCSGEAGDDGEPFAGTFTSPNGEYSISVTDAGVTLSHAGDASITLVGADITVHAGGDLAAEAGAALTVQSGAGATIASDGDLSVQTSGDLALQSDGDMSLRSGGAYAVQAATNIALGGGAVVTVQSGANTLIQSSAGLSLVGSQVRVNAGSTCPPAARGGDPVVVNTTSGAGSIVNGSATVCIG